MLVFGNAHATIQIGFEFMGFSVEFWFKGATSRITHLEKTGNFFSSLLVVIGPNLRQSKPSSVIFAFLLFPWVFSMLENYYFEASFSFKVIRKMTINTVTLLLKLLDILLVQVLSLYGVSYLKLSIKTLHTNLQKTV